MMGSSIAQTQRYEDLLYGEGSLKTVFKAVKSATAGRGLDRIFITGVSPVVLNDITSGFNIAENIYLLPQFNDLCGFSETEISDVLMQIVRDCDLPEEKAAEAMSMMRTFYNGIRQIAGDFYRTGNMQPLCDFIEQKYFKVFDNRDYRWANELTINTAFLTLLFNDLFYTMDSEASLERGYADLTMIVRRGHTLCLIF